MKRAIATTMSADSPTVAPALGCFGRIAGQLNAHMRARESSWLRAALVRPFAMRRLVFILGPAAGLLACTQPREAATADSVALPPVPETTSSSRGPSPAAVVADTMVRRVGARADSVQFRSIYEKPLNDTLTLSAAIRRPNDYELELRVSLIPRQMPQQARIIAQLQDRYVGTYEVLRTDDTSVVIGRNGLWNSMPSRKLFLHPQSKSVVKQIDYGPGIGLTSVGDSEVARLLDVSPEIIEQLKKKPWEAKPDSTHIPAELRRHPMRQSTYDEFAQARPGRVANGYGDDTVLEEEPGPYQIAGSRIWFGKTFYDGEGNSGVGGLGYFDTMTSQYAFLPVSGLADWSVSAILIEEDAAWIGLVNRGEGEDDGGGLIRYDFKSGISRRVLTEEMVHHIVRWKDRVYVVTKNGAYLVQENRLVKRYRVEPDIDNRFIIVSEDLPPNP
jgi:hypothetical protein